MTSRVRVGVVGVGRALSIGARSLAYYELAAPCDTSEADLLQAGRRLGVATYTDYSRFLEHDLDAVIIANSFHEHRKPRRSLRSGAAVAFLPAGQCPRGCTAW